LQQSCTLSCRKDISLFNSSFLLASSLLTSFSNVSRLFSFSIKCRAFCSFFCSSASSMARGLGSRTGTVDCAEGDIRGTKPGFLQCGGPNPGSCNPGDQTRVPSMRGTKPGFLQCGGPNPSSCNPGDQTRVSWAGGRILISNLHSSLHPLSPPPVPSSLLPSVPSVPS
jgi:hypothetical protein